MRSGLAYAVFYGGLLFLIVAVADIAPKMLAPGRVELLLAQTYCKPGESPEMCDTGIAWDTSDGKKEGAIFLLDVDDVTTAEKLDDGSFRFTITNLTPGKTNIVAASVNLATWTPVWTNVPVTSTVEFTNRPTPGVTKAFYRTWQVP